MKDIGLKTVGLEALLEAVFLEATFPKDVCLKATFLEAVFSKIKNAPFLNYFVLANASMMSVFVISSFDTMPLRKHHEQSDCRCTTSYDTDESAKVRKQAYIALIVRNVNCINPVEGADAESGNYEDP